MYQFFSVIDDESIISDDVTIFEHFIINIFHLSQIIYLKLKRISSHLSPRGSVISC